MDSTTKPHKGQRILSARSLTDDAYQKQELHRKKAQWIFPLDLSRAKARPSLLDRISDKDHGRNEKVAS